MYGARTSLLVGILAAGIAVTIGTLIGLLAGFFGRWTDTTLSRGADVMLAVPQLLIAIGIVASCSTTKEGCLGGLIKPGLALVIFVIALFSWPYVARVVRGNTLSLKEKEFVEASRSIGAGNVRILGGDLLPNLAAPIIVLATLLIPQSILFEAALSYLGLGVPPDQPSWGQILADASGLYDVAWWLMVFPGRVPRRDDARVQPARRRPARRARRPHRSMMQARPSRHSNVSLSAGIHCVIPA